MAAAAWVTYRFADGDQIIAQVETDSAPHPDLLDELRRNVITLYREALGVSVEALADKDERE